MTQILSGNWLYSIVDDPDFSRRDYDDAAWPTIRVPQNWFLGGLDHHGVVWYRTTFNYRPKAEFASLHFEGVDYFADVFLNGHPLGRHAGYFDPFQFEVSEYLRTGENRLAVRVDSPYETPGPDGWHIRKRLVKGVLNHHDCRPGGGWDAAGQSYNTGGIWNRVYLEEHGPLTIDRVLLHADLGGKKPILNVQLTVQNRTGKREALIEVHCAPENFEGAAQTANFKLELPAGESHPSFRVPVKDIQLWQPWDRGNPNLYNITTTLKSQKESAVRTQLFGFRSAKVEEGFRWIVNDRPYFVRGSNYIGTQWLSESLFHELASSKNHPFGGGPAGDFYARDVALAKQANLNMLRVHAHVVPPEFHTACDRAGVLVWQDFPLIWGHSDEPEFRKEAERQMCAMVTGLYNHPSIAAWCCHNETPWDSPWMAETVGGTFDPSHNRDLDAKLESLARELDPGRYVHRASGAGDRHTYPGWYDGPWSNYRYLKGSPFVSEYGAQGLPAKESLQRMLPQYGPDAGFSGLLEFKDWIEASRKTGPLEKVVTDAGLAVYRFAENRSALKKVKLALAEWAARKIRESGESIFNKTPSMEETPKELQVAREIWEAWRFHDMQFMQTFENGVETGASLDDFIANSQRYQSFIIQYGTETFRRAKYSRITGILQFDFTDPWPAITWSVLDYWRTPKPAFDALRRSMQPVLPSFLLPQKLEARKALPIVFRAINDLTDSFPSATCEWHLANEKGDLASATFPVAIPADGVSEEVKLTLPSLSPGRFIFTVTLLADDAVVGENRYDILVEDSLQDQNK
ncbi:MAG TPA: beta galactosidase jelly roll domain-containing protein [Anaerolineales bacterium]|nr:beta galactosidase jelly roll domain-containing protein [Anaerolineales bacterium]